MWEVSDVRWLDPDELAAWRNLSSVLLLLPGHLDESLAEHGLTFFDYSILVALAASDDRTRRLSDLASSTQGSLSRMSHAAKRLEQRGWLRREPSPDDGRVTLARLTEEGMATLERAAPSHVMSVRRAVFDGLDDRQVDQLTIIAASIVATMRPGQPPPWAGEQHDR